MSAGSIGPYRILEPLGSGGQGDVYLAEDTRLGRNVALKTLRDAAVGPGDARRKLLHEARAAARLNHPHIAAVYDVVEANDAVHIVMEHVPGQTLAERVRAGPLPPLQVIEVGAQLASALAHAHAHGVIHRDLKPSNVVLTGEGQAKVLDFGVARTVPMPSDLGTLTTPSTGERVLVGTPPYMPPEHLMGAPVDERGDIYCLGVTLFEALTARRPFAAKDLASLAQAILNDPTPRASTSTPSLPRGLDEIVSRAMARDPRERYAAAADLEADLKHLASRVLDATTASGIDPEGLRGPRRRPVMATTAALAVALAFGALALSSSGQLHSFGAGAGPPGPHVVAVLPLLDPSKDPQNEALTAGVADSLTTALSKLDGVTVVARSAMLRHRDRKLDTDAIAREVGATLLVDGSLQRSGEALRLTLSLLQPGSTVVQWQEAYDGDFKDVLRLQREVASAVAESLRVKLTPQARARLREKPTENVEALAEYSQARAFMERPDVKGNLDRAIDLFQSAIGKDPRFASAHAGLGEAYWRQYQTAKTEEWSIKSRDAINEALRLDPQDSAVRLAMATLYRFTGRVAEAKEEFRKVIENNSSSDEAHRQLGQLLSDLGDSGEAVAEIREAIRLRPNFWQHHFALGSAQYAAGHYRDATDAFRRVTQLQPDNAWGYQMLGASYHALDDDDNALAHYEIAVKLGSARAHTNLGLLHLNAGRLDLAEQSYKEAVRMSPDCLKQHSLGEVYLRMGRLTEAHRQLEGARSSCLAELRTSPGNGSILARLAVVEAKLGLGTECEDHIRLAVAAKPDDADVRFSEAIVKSMRNKPDEAVRALAEAIAHGYSPRRAAQEPHLSLIRKDPRAVELLRRNDSPSTTKGGTS